MFSLTNTLVRLFQYYGIYFGYTYIYIDIKNRQLKFYIIAKVYVYLINFMALVWSIEEVKSSIDLYSIELAISFLLIIVDLTDLFTIYFLLLLHIKVEKFYKKFQKIYEPLLNLYFQRGTYLTDFNKTTRIILILQIFLIFIFTINTSYNLFIRFNIGSWNGAKTFYFINLFSGLSHCILFYHGLILNYFNNILLKLNYQLQHEEIGKSYCKIYTQIFLQQQHVSKIFSPVILSVLLKLLMSIAFYMFGVFTNIIEVSYISYDNLINTSAKLLEFVNIFAYFLICERVSETRKSTGIILMEYNNRKENLQV